MQQELPNLIDERRFRRRDQDTVERDEFGRVSVHLGNGLLNVSLIEKTSENGQKQR